jgi:hypothetical protein
MHTSAHINQLASAFSSTVPPTARFAGGVIVTGKYVTFSYPFPITVPLLSFNSTGAGH